MIISSGWLICRHTLTSLVLLQKERSKQCINLPYFYFCRRKLGKAMHILFPILDLSSAPLALGHQGQWSNARKHQNYIKAQANGTMEILIISWEVCLSRNKLRSCASKDKLFCETYRAYVNWESIFGDASCFDPWIFQRVPLNMYINLKFLFLVLC